MGFLRDTKANACNISTFIRFYMQMRVEKAFVYRIYRHFTQQCSISCFSMFSVKIVQTAPECLNNSLRISMEFRSKEGEKLKTFLWCQTKPRNQTFANVAPFRTTPRHQRVDIPKILNIFFCFWNPIFKKSQKFGHTGTLSFFAIKYTPITSLTPAIRPKKWRMTHTYDNTGCGVFKGGIQN